MKRYASLFVKWLIPGNKHNGHLDFLLEKGIPPEVGLQHGGSDFSAAEHKETAARIKDHGLACAIHLPFYDVVPGSADRKVQAKSRDILLRAVEIAEWYGADHLIGHPEFYPPDDSLLAQGRREQDAADRPTEIWLEQSVKAWGEVMQNTGSRLYLENTNDQTPEAILTLLERLPDQAAMCFDIGHWFMAADGIGLNNLPEWLTAVAPRLGHLHLHDNHGQADEHLGIGQGLIDYGPFLNFLAEHNLRPSYTLEAHQIIQLSHSLGWLENLPRGTALSFP